MAVMLRLMRAFESRDAATVRNLISQRSETLIVGSDAREWLYGVEGYEIAAAQALETPKYRLTIRRIDAFAQGTVGWAAADTTTNFENGKTVDFRLTAVFVLEDGAWRVVQWHASVPVPTIETSGADLPTSLADLLDAVGGDALTMLDARFRTSTVTLLFSDIEDSTSHAIDTGDAIWGDVVRRHLAELHRIAGGHDGVVVKTLGDGAMLAFRSARDGARAANAIQRAVATLDSPASFKVRVGVHTGDAMHSDGDYFGQMVNKTARIAGSAAGGEVFVSDVARGLVGNAPGLEFGEPISLTLKGIPGTHTVYPVIST